MLSWIIGTYCGCPEACLMSPNLANAEIHPSVQESSDLESESEIANEEDSD